MQPMPRGLGMRCANVQQHTKVREHRIGRENVMKIGVAGTVAEMFDFDIAVADAGKRTQLLESNMRATLTVESLLGVIDHHHLRQVFVLQWLQTLVNYIPELAPYKPKVADIYRTCASKFRVPDKKTVIHPLGTASKNENVITELRDAMIDFERLLKLKQYMQFQDSAFKRFENIIPFLKKVDYYSSIYLAYLVLDVRMLDCNE